MNKLNQLISQFSRILVVFLAGFILLISTACSNANPPQASSSGNLRSTPNYDYYDANQPEQGGMNKYNDDTRLDDRKMQKKADNAVNQARTNLEQRNDTGEALGKIKEDVAQRTEQFKKDISQGTQRGIDTTKNNLEKASRNIARTAEDASDTLQNKANDTAKATRRAAEDTLDTTSDPS